MKSYLQRIVNDYNSLVRTLKNKILDILFPQTTFRSDLTTVFFLKNQPNRVLKLAPGLISRPKYNNCFKRPFVFKGEASSLLKFELERIKDGDFIIKTLPKYGKALEEFVEHGTFTIDGTDLIDLYNNGVVNTLESVPYYNVLSLIFQYEIYETRLEGTIVRASKINGVSNASIVPELIKIYRQLTLYGYKVEIPLTSDDINIHTRKYIVADAETSMHVSMSIQELLSSPDGQLLHTAVKSIIGKICDQADHILSKYTSQGIVINNIIDGNDSYKRVGYDAIINMSFNHSNGSTSDTERKSRFVQRRLYDIPYDSVIFHSADSFDVLRDISSSDTAKLTFVPKDSRGPRTICMEPAYLGFVQQMYMTLLYKILPDVTNYAIDLQNQDNNRYLALKASSSGKYATIDLSNASDSVMSLHIQELFPARWIDILNKCRSISVLLPDGSTLRPHKFAPMGSALCFPIECIIFYAITRAVLGSNDLSVYGDDIIVPTSSVEKVMSALEAYGFTVNRRKSFYKSLFRESCGIFAYKGVDVSCIYRRDINAEVDHYNELINKYSCDIAPQSFIRLPDTEGCLNKIPTIGELSRYINSGIFAWDVHLQRVCVRVRVHRNRHTGDTLPDNLAYSEWLRLYSGEDNTYLEKPRVIPRRQETDTMVEKFVPTNLPYSEFGYIHQLSLIHQHFGYMFSPDNWDRADSQDIHNIKRGVRYVRFKKPKETKTSKGVEQSRQRDIKKGNGRHKTSAQKAKTTPTRRKTSLVSKKDQKNKGTKG